jgi:hypothetical protein
MMEKKGFEKRVCARFEVPGTTLQVQKRKLFRKVFSREVCPVLDLSRGGLSFLSRKRYPKNKRVLLRVFIFDEHPPLLLKGRVRWSSPSPEERSQNKIQIKFLPYGHGPEMNDIACLEKLRALEDRFGEKSSSQNESP